VKRVFVPLKRKYFELIKQGKKRVELRSENSPVARQFIRRFVRTARFRCGYRGESLIAGLELIWFGKRDEIPDELLELACVTQDEVESMFKADEEVWAFKLNVLEMRCPTCGHNMQYWNPKEFVCSKCGIVKVR